MYICTDTIKCNFLSWVVAVKNIIKVSFYKNVLGLGYKKREAEVESSDGSSCCDICSLPVNLWNGIVDNLAAWMMYLKHPGIHF
jgi:hypothetical protein